MVEAVWHGVFMVLGWSVNGRLVRQQYAPNHSSSPGIFSDFLSGLNHGAIQFANKERPECINVTLLCFHSLWPGDFGKSLAGYSLPHFAELKEQFSQKLNKISHCLFNLRADRKAGEVFYSTKRLLELHSETAWRFSPTEVDGGLFF